MVAGAENHRVNAGDRLTVSQDNTFVFKALDIGAALNVWKVTGCVCHRGRMPGPKHLLCMGSDQPNQIGT